MRADEVREKSSDDLVKLAKELKDELFGLRFKHARGELKQTSNIKKAKRDLARVKNEIVKRSNSAKA